MKTPLTKYFGGKTSRLRFLLPLVPPHNTYVEVFGGSGALLFAKTPSPVEVFNDIDSEVVNFFKVLQDREKFDEFYRIINLTPYSRQIFKECVNTLGQGTEVERAVKFFVAVKQSFGGNLRDWGFNVGSKKNGSVNAYLNTIERLPEVVERIKRVQIENYDYKEIYKIYDTPETFFYNDPPYVEETLKTKNPYRFNFTLDDHKELVEVLIKAKGMVMLSGYDHPVYDELERNGFKKFTYKTFINNSGGTRPSKRVYREECVWVNKKLLSRLNGLSQTEIKLNLFV